MAKVRKLWTLQLLEEQQEKQKLQIVDPSLVKQLKSLKQEIEVLQSQLKDLKGQYQRAKEEVNSLERAGVECKEKQGQLNEKIYDGSLQSKEIKNYQQRLAKLNEELTSSEDQQLEVMQQREDIKGMWEEKKQQLTTVTAQYKTLHENYLQQKEEIKTRATDLAREITELIQEIGTEELELFRQLQKKHRRPVGRVTKDTCSGCHLGISFDKIKQLKNPDGAVHCNHCGRLLLWDPV